jgi:anhydro-N-acetylmuramic acid kinase
MTGTSGDGIDCVLFDVTTKSFKASYYQPFDSDLSKQLMLFNEQTVVNLESLMAFEALLTERYAEAVQTLLKEEGLKAKDIRVLGCHGQTLYHQASKALTLQLCDGGKLAYLTNLEVVCDFRRADIARKGQGAPFAPLIHHAFFLNGKQQRAVVNIGGIANVSLLRENGHLCGFDVGPGNVLLDAWVQEHWQKPFDYNGSISKSGQVIDEFLVGLRKDPWFQKQGPKSLDRMDFSLSWLKSVYPVCELKKEDVLRTLVAFSAELISEAVKINAPKVNELLVCGGGAKNQALMTHLSNSFTSVHSTDHFGVDADFIEAALFAWLAYKRVSGEVVNWHGITGARQPGIYGAHYLP